MIVNINKSEMRFLQDLRRAAKDAPNQKFFYLKFSASDLPRQKMFETFLGLLEQVPNSYLAHIYICEDNDILFSMPGLTQRDFVDFVQRLADTLKASHLTELMHIFEAGLHKTKLEEICGKKVEIIERRAEREKEELRKMKADKATLEILSRLDADMVLSIPARRQKRKKPLIMVVDDDQLSRTLVYNVLDREYRTVLARNGKEALQEYIAEAPDILFLDIGLPDITGHDLLEAFAQIDPDNYIIMFSGRKDKENMLKALRLGAQGFVGKPFSRDKLMHFIAKSPFVQAKSGEKFDTKGMAV